MYGGFAVLDHSVLLAMNLSMFTPPTKTRGQVGFIESGSIHVPTF